VIESLLRRLREALDHIAPRVAAPVAPSVPAGPRPLYLFFDEAGDLDFGAYGSRYFLCGVLVTYDPWPLMQVLTDLREEVFRGGFIPRAFHAAEDRQAVRDRVFEEIVGVGGFEAHITVTEKGLVPPSHRDASTFYTFMADFTLRMALQRYPSDEPILVITDELPLKSKRDAIVKGFQASLASILAGRVFRIEHHSSGSQQCLQVIDYIAWSVFRRWERGDSRSHSLVKDYIVRESGVDWTLVRTP
jgi:uncharacterized protein DUF3800